MDRRTDRGWRTRAAAAVVPTAAALTLALAGALICALVAVVLVPAPARAASPMQPETLLAAMAPASLDDLQSAAQRARTQMQRLEKQMAVIQARFESATAQLDQISTQLGDTRLELAASQMELDRQSALVGRRLATMYKMDDLTWLDAIFGSSSFSDLQSRIAYFDLINEQDRYVGTDLAELTDRTQDLEQDIGERREEALGVQAEIDAQRAIMNEKIAARRAVLDDLVRQIRKLLARKVADHSGLLDRAAAARGEYTPLTWARALLANLGLPISSENLAAIVAWELAEGGHWHNTAHFNPLNTTQPAPGATGMNSVGVKAYVSWTQGFRATVTTLHNGYYEGILSALRRGDDAIAVAHAVAASPWGTGNFQSLL